MGWFIFFIVLAVAGIITIAYGAAVADKKGQVVFTGVVVLVVAFLLFLITGIKNVPTKSIGVATSFGKVTGQPYGPGAQDAELREALAAARLDLDLDTAVGEHGARLSGGMRQRLALARALLARFPVLVLDEPAEHLDVATADALTADLLAATRGRTTLLITHRLAGLAAHEGADSVDEIVVLDRGRIVQRGSYAELAAVDGPFRRTLERERATDTAAAPRQPAVTAAA